MHFTVLSLFPEMFKYPYVTSVIKKAIDSGKIEIDSVNIRDFATDKYKTVDGRPYGGGQGMILRVDIVDRCLNSVLNRNKTGRKKTCIILTDPQGEKFNQRKAEQLSEYNHIIIIAGHYEGVDERIRSLVDKEISVGDFVLTGGEIPAMLMIDCVSRLTPGFFKKNGTTENESFSDNNLLEYPQYTRPAVYKNMKVPDILTGGNHSEIQKWKIKKSAETTLSKRPDLIKKN